MESIKISACAPPYCKCPEMEVYQTEDQETRIMISDDYSGVVNMSFREFCILVDKFLDAFCPADDEEYDVGNEEDVLP